jgi:hypothetical protein
MATQQTISQRLYDLLATRGFDPQTLDAKTGRDVPPADAQVLKFDYTSSTGKNYGTAVIVLSDDQQLILFFGDNLGKSMESPDKDEWFQFLQQLSQFATRNDFNTFSPQNLNQLKQYAAGIAAIREGLFEGYYGTRQVSYMGKTTEARLMIRHNRTLGEDDARHRHIQSLFIETQDGERFRLPFVSLAGGRAMLEHVRQGGRPYDIRGSHIANMVQEAKLLSRFRRASQGRMLEGVTQEVASRADVYYQNLRENLRSLAHARGYQNYFETWAPDEAAQSDALVEDLKQLFVEKTLDHRIEEALPLLARIQEQPMKEAEIFESWINNLSEGTWALPDTPEAVKKLKKLMAQELPVGPDATNATEQLYELFGDDELFDRLGDLADRDPDADARDIIRGRASELGIDLDEPGDSNTDAVEPDTAEPQATEPQTEPAPEQPAVADNTQLPVMPVAESRNTDDEFYVVSSQGIEAGPFKTRAEAKAKKEKAPAYGYQVITGKQAKRHGFFDDELDEGKNPISQKKERELVKLGIFPSGAEAAHYKKQLGRAGKISTRQMKSLEKGKHPGGPNERDYVNRMHSDDPAPMEGMTEDEYDESELCNGCYVRDEQDGPNGEVFRMTGDPNDRRVRIDDRQGRGWYISPSRLILVSDDDPAVARWFGRDDDLGEGDNLATFVGPNEDSTDAMDHRGAVTDSFYEDLAKIKRLALSK